MINLIYKAKFTVIIAAVFTASNIAYVTAIISVVAPRAKPKKAAAAKKAAGPKKVGFHQVPSALGVEIRLSRKFRFGKK